MSLVLDALVTMAWSLGDERTDLIRALFAEVAIVGAVVPGLWALEVANSLSVCIRRGRMTIEERAEALGHLSDLTIETDDLTNFRAWTSTVALADLHRLTVYDAAYMELALRRGLPLATLDKELVAAARISGVPVRP